MLFCAAESVTFPVIRSLCSKSPASSPPLSYLSTSTFLCFTYNLFSLLSHFISPLYLSFLPLVGKSRTEYKSLLAKTGIFIWKIGFVETLVTVSCSRCYSLKYPLKKFGCSKEAVAQLLNNCFNYWRWRGVSLSAGWWLCWAIPPW